MSGKMSPGLISVCIPWLTRVMELVMEGVDGCVVIVPLFLSDLLLDLVCGCYFSTLTLPYLSCN